MRYEPRPYQPEATQHVIEVPRCNLWLDPGLGKTSITLTALDALWLAGSRFWPALVIAPVRVARRVWSDEAARWDHLQGLRVQPVIGTARQRAAALKAQADVYTINYENLPWLVDRLSGDWPFRYLIADESTRLKSFRLRRGGKRARALSRVTKLTGRWVNLTGTPAPNGLIDLWGQNWFVDGGERLGRTFTAFKDRWFSENQFTREITPKPSAQQEISAALADVTYSLKADDVFDLPPMVEDTIRIDLPPKARKVYDDMERQMFVELGSAEVEALNAASLSGKCLQIASGALYTNAPDEARDWAVVHDEKIDALRELLSELSGNPLLVAYHFKSDLARLKKAFPAARELRTAADEDAWNRGEIPMLLAHPASAGHGLNLQRGGHHLAFFSHWWDLEAFQQIIERIGPVRQAQSGYNRTVFIYHLVTSGTVDEVVVARRQSKRSVQDALRSYARGKA